MQLEQQFHRLWSPELWQQTRVLIAISGGADSVALLRSMLRLTSAPNMLCAAHFNHGWRGADSEADQAFVVECCQQLDVELHLGRADSQTSAPAPMGRSEERAREERYAFLTSTAYATGARYVATAHTASDRVETLLHHLFRGTGLSGVCTPTLFRPLDRELVLVRPLLSCWRSDVVEYLQLLEQPFRNDASNADISLRRNWIRHVLLPSIRHTYGQHVDEKLLDFSQIAEEAIAWQQQLAVSYLEEVDAWSKNKQELTVLKQKHQGAFVFPLDQQNHPWPVVRQALCHIWMDRRWPLQKMNRNHWEQLRCAWNANQQPSLDGEVSSVELNSWNLPGNLQLERHNDYLVLRCTSQPEA